MRDWRSGLITITVRDQRNREHDPILGVVPLRLSELLTTSSQVTRWFPLDGGIGFGRIRISVLFRSIETRLPPNMLGWDVGTFEFLSDQITSTGWTHNTKLKLRTGGSVAKIPRTHCHKNSGGDGMYWDISPSSKRQVRMPVKHRYRSPIIFEFHVTGKRGAAAYASLWLQHLVDNEEVPIDIPIWKTKNGNRLVQNYITERNVAAKETPGLEDIEEVGRLQFRGRFKAGTDESHRDFVVDNDTRETFETWEACLAEGVRERVVEAEVPQNIQEMHDKSLTEGRDILKEADARERKKWVDKKGEDWSGAFGDDPKAYMNKEGEKIAEPGRDKPPHDPVNPSSDEDNDNAPESSSDSDLGIHDASNPREGGFKRKANGRPSSGSNRDMPRESMDTQHTNDTGYTTMTSNSVSPVSKRDAKWDEKADKRTEERKHRGLSQWMPARNVKFARDEAKIGMSKLKQKMGMGPLAGREPGVETEA